MNTNPLTVKMAGLELASPLVLSSGILGISASSLGLAARNGAGAVTSKSCGLSERSGHKCPTVLPFEHGILNAVGLSNPGVDVMAQEISEYRKRFGSQAPVIASIFGASVEEFGEVAERIAAARPDMIEVNVSCPNVASEFGQPFGADPAACARITSLVRKKVGKIPLSIKLTSSCASIGTVAKVCEDNGADAITAINSIGPGMLIDLNVRKPVLSNRTGGVSGACILPIAVRCVWDIYRSVKIPIIGGGGVMQASDALQLIMAGASAVGIGSAVYKPGLAVFNRINGGIMQYINSNSIQSFSSLVGAAHVA
ncbi:MAG: Dihydroorotate dehydrogenase B (NAD(+)), catalytic subunit [bacterium ADurb.Bin374]|nr:MAG: Dihydroorotate dehydrogenase B (NAD(+)), catalytic subunit [bacterium ADurb.Bin374]